MNRKTTRGLFKAPMIRWWLKNSVVVVVLGILFFTMIPIPTSPLIDALLIAYGILFLGVLAGLNALGFRGWLIPPHDDRDQ